MPKKINFEKIGQIMQAFDTDKMDIYRSVNVIKPDGTTGTTDLSQPLYTDIACHVAFITSDNPDTKTVDTKPVVVGLQINCSLDVDLQNGDYIKASKLADNGSVLEVYSGIIGQSTVTQSRKSAEMKMETDV